MNFKNIASTFLLAGWAYSAISCSTTNNTQKMTEVSIAIPQPKGNIFLKKSSLQYQAPEFDKIKDSDYRPAFDYGLKVQEAEIEKIINNPDAPTFENTVLALEHSGEVLNRARTVFYNLVGTNINPELQKIQKDYSAVFAAHSDKIYLNAKLYERIKKVAEQKDKIKDAESKRLVAYYLEQFELAGANLSDEKKREMKKINAEMASLSTDFSTKLLEARKNSSLLIEDVKELDGLSADEIAAAAAAAKKMGHDGKYLLTIYNTTQQPMMQSLHNRKTREKLYKASWFRSEKNDSGDTQDIIIKLAKLRLKKAQLLGKKSFAEWKLQDQMAKTPEEALQLLSQLAKPAVETAQQEAKEIQKLIDQQNGGFKIEPWDWSYYAEQVRKAKYDLDENELKPYFEVNTVLEKGVFFAAEKFFGITAKKRTDLPVYHPEVLVYEIFDHNGKSMALFYIDFFSRESKRGGAWMSSFVKQAHSLGQKPVVVNVLNYQKPANGKPALISYDEVTTLFHEFGHGLHGMFANQKYGSLSGTSVARDFVELPSQMNEFFALEPTVLKNYAIHYETKQPMPQVLVDKLKKSLTFNQGFSTIEVVAAATLDMAWHSITDESQIKSVQNFETETLKKYGVYMPQIPPRYHSPFFAHIWGGGYSAGYYAYMWSDLLCTDAWDWVQTNGGMTRANGDKFRKTVLSTGNTVEFNQAYRNFTGRNPNIMPLLRLKGFVK
ncbi:M3 family metallopeptidase [Bergeyella zoohelcum]|uniref:M3 family metallopeptidase n=1 Tax=Bergeyella zoohelcum TaxID=1015 RepID=UPI003734E098